MIGEVKEIKLNKDGGYTLKIVVGMVPESEELHIGMIMMTQAKPP